MNFDISAHCQPQKNVPEMEFKSVNLEMISRKSGYINLESASPIFQSTHPHKLDLPQHSHTWILIQKSYDAIYLNC